MRKAIFPLLVSAILAALFWFVLVSPLLAWRTDLKEENNQKQSQLMRVERALVNLKDLESSRQGQSVTAFQDDFLIRAARPQVIARMQKRMRALSLKQGCQLNRSTGLDPLVSDGQTWLGLSLQIQCPFVDLQKLLHTMEYSPPYLFIRRANLRPRVGQRGQNFKQLSMMIAEIDLYGAVWPFGSDDRQKAVMP